MTESQNTAKPPAGTAEPSPAGAPTNAGGAATPPAPVSPSGEPTPWKGDPGFPVAPGWMLVDPRWLRKGIPRWLHYGFFVAWALFVAYIVFLFLFHSPGPEGFKQNPPTGLPGQAQPAASSPASAPTPSSPANH